jgi:hypothetical protein
MVAGPVVLIHGWPLSAQAWAPQVAVLQAAGFRVVVYDHDTLADDPVGPLTPDKAQHNRQALAQDRGAHFDGFTRNFFSAHGLNVSHAQVFNDALLNFMQA